MRMCSHRLCADGEEKSCSCQWLVCCNLECVMACKAVKGKKCSQGHALKYFYVPDDNYTCDLCEKVVGKGTMIFGCRNQCVWKICCR